MTAKNVRIHIKTTRTAKITLEQAAGTIGSTLSGFMLNCAMSKAMEVLAPSDNIICLTRTESKRFLAALHNPPEANDKLQQLFQK